MGNLFSQILNMSLTGSVVILLVMLVRLLLKRSPKIFSYALWSVVLFRLLCPVSVSAPVSVLEVFQPDVRETSDTASIVYYLPAQTAQDPGVTFVSPENPAQSQTAVEAENPSRFDPMAAAACAWMAGVAVMLLCSVVQYLRLRVSLIGAMGYKGNVYLSDYIDSPFVMGILEPKIYLPSTVPMKERRFIIAHEKHHIRRFDHIIKLLAYLALCVHWFNPLVWTAFILAGKDMEMSCDEAVIKKLGAGIRADYSESLLRLATHKKIIAGMPLAFGEGDTKGRVMNMARWKKPRIWVSLICVVLCAAVLVACAVNPDSGKSTITTEVQASAETIKITLENDPLPEGYFEELDGDGNIIFTDGNNTVGGVLCYRIPEGIYDPDDKYFDWLAKMGIPDFVDQNLYYLGGITSGDNGWAAEFTDDSDNEANRTVYRRHTFQVVGDAVFDIWFDLLNISYSDADEIRRAVNIPESLPDVWMPTVPGSDIVTDTELIQYGDLRFLLPSGLAAADDNGVIVLTMDSETVGGAALRYQEQPNSPASFSQEWQAGLGVPEASDPAMAYMGSGSNYADYEITYFPDMPVNRDENGNIIQDELGTYVLEHEVTHYFFVNGTDVYDLWFYVNRLPNVMREKLLKSCYIEGVTDIAAMESAQDKETKALEKCSAVLDAVQAGSYKIISRQINEGNEGPKGYERIYCRNNEDWLSVTNVLTEGDNFADGTEYAVTKSALFANGRRFSYTGTEWVEIANDENSLIPWLADFTWDENIVAYMDTLTDENGECIWLRVDEKYAGSDENAPHYFVFFHFDLNGNFVNAEIQVNLFMENEFAVTESIVSLDPDTVDAEIREEYRKAVE